MTGVETTWVSVDWCVALVNNIGMVEVVGLGQGKIRLIVGSIVRSITFEITEHLTLSNREVLVAFHNATDGPNWHERHRMAERTADGYLVWCSYRSMWSCCKSES